MNRATIVFENLSPPWLWLAVIAVSLAAIAGIYSRIFSRTGRKMTWILMATRGLAVLALWLAIVKPAWTRILERETRPRLAVVIDNSESMAFPHAGDDASRYRAAIRWLTESEPGAALFRTYDVSLSNLAGDALKADELPAEPVAEQTDLVRAVRTAAHRIRGQGQAGILLISDGRDTTARENYVEMRRQPVPVYGLGFRSRPPAREGTPDLAVLSVDAPEQVLVHNTAPLKVLVGKDGGSATEISLQVERAGTLLADRQVSLPAGRTEKLVPMEFTPVDPGNFVLAVRIPPLPREPSPGNNVRMFRLHVAAEPIRVLYVEGVLRAEYTFLRNRLLNDPDIDLVSFVRVATPAEGRTRVARIGRELLTQDRLDEFDVVVLGDFEADMLDPEAYGRLRAWVDGGGGLMVLGGYRNLGPSGLALTPLHDVLPVEDPPGAGLFQVEEPFSFSFTPEGILHPVATITGNAVQDADLWRTLPRLSGAVGIARARPGATVLARHPRRSPEGDAGFVVLAAQPYGKGLAMLFTADTTWRWSRVARLRGEPDMLYSRFWSQAVRYLAKRDPQSERTAITIGTDSPSYERGDRVTVHVQRNPAVMVPGGEGQDTAIEVSVRSPDGRLSELPARTDGSNPDRWDAPFFPSRGGRYEVSARLMVIDPEGRHERAHEISEFLVNGSALELDDSTANPAALSRMARLSGGVYADMADERAVARLMDSIPDAPAVSRERRTTELWNSPALFLVFLALATTEWIVRRRNHLV